MYNSLSESQIRRNYPSAFFYIVDGARYAHVNCCDETFMSWRQLSDGSWRRYHC